MFQAVVVASMIMIGVNTADPVHCGAKEVLDGSTVLDIPPYCISLELSEGSVSDQIAVKIAVKLSTHSGIKVLSLGNNAIGDVGAAAIAKVLVENISLREVDLSFNLIGKCVCRVSRLCAASAERQSVSLLLIYIFFQCWRNFNFGSLEAPTYR